MDSAANSRFVGFALIALGVFFLLPLVTSFEFSFDMWWPLIVIITGIGSLTKNVVWGGLITIAIGVALLLNNLDIFTFNVWLLWPVILIVVGATIVLGYTRRPRFQSPANGSAGTTGTYDDLNVTCLFSGAERRIASQAFRGGQVSTTFGGASIDLRNAALADGAATICVNAMFGGVDIRVPDDWAVNVQVSATFGGTETKRPEPANSKATLTVTGSCLFGGVSIKS